MPTMMTTSSLNSLPTRAGSTHYKYKHLRAGEIRILEILPHNGDEHQAIRCSLTTAYLEASEPPKYEALSYCWSQNKTDTPNRIIRLDDQPIAVMPNLHNALMRLRHARKTRTLWADAICINQDDTLERGAQVAIMRDIYAKCSRVVIWLGRESSDSTAGMSLARELAAVSRRHQQSPKPLTLEQKRVNAPAPDDPRYQSLFALLERRWFTRVWMIQEVSLSPDPCVMCGPDEISWDDLTDALFFVAGAGLVLNIPTDAFSNLVSFYNARAHFQKGIRPQLLSLVLQFRSFQATNNRDKIFSLLGLAHEEDVSKLGIKPDYDDAFTVKALYLQFARQILRTRGDLAILSTAWRPQGMDGINDLPSWVPDWTVGELVPLQTLQRLDNPNGRPLVFLASGRTRHREIQASTENNERLTVEGFVWDRIAAISSHAGAPVLGSPVGEPKSWPEMLRIPIQAQRDVAEWKRLAYRSNLSHRGSYANSETIEDAFWQTLIAGCRPEEKSSLREEYHQWRAAGRVDRLLGRMKVDINYPRTFIVTKVLHTLISATPAAASRNFSNRFSFAYQRTMIMTGKRYIGLVPASSRVGDRIAILKGGAVPFVLRQAADGCWALVGECYVHGIMHGEVFDEGQCAPMILR